MHMHIHASHTHFVTFWKIGLEKKSAGKAEKIKKKKTEVKTQKAGSDPESEQELLDNFSIKYSGQ